ncbi:MAG: putative toxin-antitoxin system toxin component, PIN family [Gammaproteobacteria bacterium]|nr:putative toxin-antitoxin system toxin component, PIN family [Gammaproteobacteria bacterium]
MKIVLDTNVLVAGFISPFGPPAAILRAVLTGSMVPCFDERILAEYRDVLTRGKFCFDRHRVDDFLRVVETNGLPVLADPLRLVLPDTSDAMFVEVAIAAGADCLVTGNLRHFPVERLRTVSPSEETCIMTPREFLDRFLDGQENH